MSSNTHIFPILDTGGNTNYTSFQNSFNDVSLIYLYWSDIINKPSFCNIALTGNYNDLSNLPSFSTIAYSGNYNDLFNQPWISNSSNIYNLNSNIGIGKTNNISEKLDIIGNIKIAGNIYPNECNVFNLGTSNNRWKDIYLSGNSIDLNNLILSKDNNSYQLNIKDNYGNLANLSTNQIISSNLMIIGDFSTIKSKLYLSNQLVINTNTSSSLVINHSNQNYNIAEFNYYTNPLLVISLNSNIGINKSNPNSSYKLDVNGNINTNDLYLNNFNISNIFITSNVFSNTSNFLNNYNNLTNKPNIYTKEETSNIFITSNIFSNTSNYLINYNNLTNKPNIYTKEETSNIFITSNVFSNTSNFLNNYNNLTNKPNIYTKEETSNIFITSNVFSNTSNYLINYNNFTNKPNIYTKEETSNIFITSNIFSNTSNYLINYNNLTNKPNIYTKEETSNIFITSNVFSNTSNYLINYNNLTNKPNIYTKEETSNIFITSNVFSNTSNFLNNYNNLTNKPNIYTKEETSNIFITSNVFSNTSNYLINYNNLTNKPNIYTKEETSNIFITSNVFSNTSNYLINYNNLTNKPNIYTKEETSNIFITSNVFSNTSNYLINYNNLTNKPNIYTKEETSNIFITSNVLSNTSNYLINYNNLTNKPNIYTKEETSNIFITSNVFSNTSNYLINYNNLTNKPNIYTKEETSNIFITSNVFSNTSNYLINYNNLTNKPNIYTKEETSNIFITSNVFSNTSNFLNNYNNLTNKPNIYTKEETSNIFITSNVFSNTSNYLINYNNLTNKPNIYTKEETSNIFITSNLFNANNTIIDTKINNINTDTITIGSSNKFITNNKYENDITFTKSLSSSNIITSNLNVNGDFTYITTTVYQTEKLEVLNHKNGSALSVKQTSLNQNIAEFYNNTNLTLIITSNNTIGINKNNPNYSLDINGSLNTSNLYLNNFNISNVFVTSNVLSNTLLNYIVNSGSLTNNFTKEETSNIFITSNVLSNTSNYLINYNNLNNKPNIYIKEETSNIFITSNVLSNTSNYLINYNNLTNKPNIYTKEETSNIFITSNVFSNTSNYLINYNNLTNKPNIYTKEETSNIFITSNVFSNISNNLINYNNLTNKPNIYTKEETSNIFITSNVFSNTSNYLINYNNLTNNPWINLNTNIYTQNNGNVGIGTSLPLSKLDVSGDINLSGSLKLNNSILPFSFYSNTNITSSNGIFNYIQGNNSYGYYSFLTNGSIIFPQTTQCDVLVVGAGGNGGYSFLAGNNGGGGGGGGGEVVAYPNYSFAQGNYNIQIGTQTDYLSSNLRISKIYIQGGNNIITANGGGDGGFINNFSLSNLFQNKKPWGIYFAENWSGTTISDSSGNNRHATTAGSIIKTTDSGNGAIGPITYISGGTTSTVSFPDGSIPSTFTILSLTRYNGGVRRRIINSRNAGNWLHGHWDSRRGVVHYDAWRTNQTTIGNLDDWLCIIAKNDTRSTNFSSNILADGAPIATVTGGTGNYSMGINLNTGETSDWCLSCVMIWNSLLTDNEMGLLNDMVNQYKINGNNMLTIVNAINTIPTIGGSGGGGGGGSGKNQSAAIGFFNTNDINIAFIQSLTTITGGVSTNTTIDSSNFYTSFTSGTSSLNITFNCVVDILVVGGGGGGANYGSGGGGGDVIYKSSFSLNAGTYIITIGNGGNGGTTNWGEGFSGETSSITGPSNFTTIFAAGGQGGYGYGGSPTATPTAGSVATNNYSSGGGGGQSSNYGPGSGNGVSGNGGNSANGLGGGGTCSGGGGGAVGNGGNAISGKSGTGGSGFSSSITGSAIGYGGGGGGGSWGGSGNNAGDGVDGGGNGASENAASGTTYYRPTTGATNRGGGGGGGGGNGNSSSNGANGGSGIVIIRFNINNITSIGTKFHPNYSFLGNGSNGTSTKGGDGGSANYNETITGMNLRVGDGGFGATSNSLPSLKYTYGTGGDGNGGLGTQGIVIIKVPLNIQRAKFDGYINYSNIDNHPIINQLVNSTNFINFGFYNQVNFPLADVSWANEWFLYMGNSPTSQLNSFIFWHLNSNATTNINSKWWFNGTQTSTNNELSDSRVKKEITDIQNPLEKLMLLKPKEYYLCDEKDYLKKYGIIAQDVNSNQELSHLVYKDDEYIANVYENAIYVIEANFNNQEKRFLLITQTSIIEKIEIGDNLKLLLDNMNIENIEIIIEETPYHNRYKKRYVKVKSIINDYTIEIEEEIEISESEKNNILIFGKKVNDFNKLDYSSLYSLNIQCTQELYKLVQEQEIIINELEQNIIELEYRNNLIINSNN